MVIETLNENSIHSSTFKCILALDNWSHHYFVLVMMGKQKRYFSDYYKTITHVQNVNALINAQISTIEKKSSGRQRRRRTDIAIFTVNLVLFFKIAGTYILGYEFVITASVTSWRWKVGAITGTWPCCHGCHFIIVWCFIFGGLLQKC